MSKSLYAITGLLLVAGHFLQAAESFDAAPFGLPLADGQGIVWEDPREVHRVVVEFESAPKAGSPPRIEYWGSRWPNQHLPKDKEPGGGSVGWMELGNWYNGGWRTADAKLTLNGARAEFTFHPVNQKEFPQVKDYPAEFRYTLKLRFNSDQPLPKIKNLQVFTDSMLAERQFRLVFGKRISKPELTVFNGRLRSLEKAGARSYVATVLSCQNSDPNTFDRTVISVESGKHAFSFAADSPTEAPIYIPEFSVAVLPGNDGRDYDGVVAALASLRGASLYDRVQTRPEQTWDAALEGIPRKRSLIYFPLGLDGGRQRFRLDADGSIRFRSNDNYLKGLPGNETPRLDLEPANGFLRFDMPSAPSSRSLDEQSLPVCRTTWDVSPLHIEQTAVLTALEGTRSLAPVPEPDTLSGCASEHGTRPAKHGGLGR